MGQCTNTPPHDPQVQAIVDHHHPTGEHSASKVRFKENEPTVDSDAEAEMVSVMSVGVLGSKLWLKKCVPVLKWVHGISNSKGQQR